MSYELIGYEGLMIVGWRGRLASYELWVDRVWVMEVASNLVS